MSAPAPVSTSTPPPDSPSTEEVLQQLETLLGSTPLRESHQLQSFLEFIVKESLDGRADGLKEYTLGCRVFGRREDYDPRHDGIVRVQATTLRKRLDKYYTEDGLADSVIITLPRGGYVPAFRYNRSAPSAAPDTAVAVPAPAQRPWIAAVAGMAFMALCWLIWSATHTPPTPSYHMTRVKPTDFPQLWSSFFEPGSHTLIGFGVPLFYQSGGLYMRDVMVNRPEQEGNSRIHLVAESLKLNPIPTDDIYTGIGELVGANLLSNYLTANGVPVRLVNTRTIGDSDLAGQNVVVVSSMRFQTLLADLHLPTDFEFVPVSPEILRNPRALPGEKKEYVFTAGAGISTSYALVSLWPSVTPGRRILLISGVHTWATQAATEFALQPDELRKMARIFEADHNGAHGKPSPYFQILLKVEGRGNTSQKVEYVTHHYLPADIKLSR